MSQHTAGPERPLPPPVTTRPAPRSRSRSTGAGRVIPPFFRGVRAAPDEFTPEAGYADKAPGTAPGSAPGTAQLVDMPEAHSPAVPVEWYVTESAPPEDAAAAAAGEFEAPAAEAEAHVAEGDVTQADFAEADFAEADFGEGDVTKADFAEADFAEADGGEAAAAETAAAEEPQFLVDVEATADPSTIETEPDNVWSEVRDSPDQEASGGEREPSPADEGWFGWGDPATGRGVAEDEPTGFEPPPPYDTASWEAPRTDHPGMGTDSAAAGAGGGYPLEAFLVSSDSTNAGSPAGEGRDLAERVAVQLDELARDLRENGMAALASRSTSGELARLLAAVVAGFYARDH